MTTCKINKIDKLLNEIKDSGKQPKIELAKFKDKTVVATAHDNVLRINVDNKQVKELIKHTVESKCK